MDKLPPGNYPAEYEIEGSIVREPPIEFLHYSKVLVAADLRRFTETMEELHEFGDPAQMGTFLSKLFDATAAIAKIQDGLINKYLGDGFLIHYPISDPSKLPDILNRIMMGLYEITSITFPQLRKNYHYDKLGLSIVISKDSEVLMGRMGGIEYADYSLLGSSINSLFRALDVAKGNLIIVTKELVQFLRNKWIFVKIGEQIYDGIYRPMSLYSVLRNREEDETNKFIRGCDKYECRSYHICNSAYRRGKAKKDMINCQYCKHSDELYLCSLWDKCKLKQHYGEAKNNFENFTCCHICKHFKSCFHSYFLGRFDHEMIWCGEPHPYKHITTPF